MVNAICISETWLSQYHTNQMVSIHGFKLLRHDRNRITGYNSRMRGGGIGIYLRCDHNYTILIKSKPNEIVEYMEIEVQIITEPIVIWCIYNPPLSSNLIEIENTLENLTSHYNNIVLLDDFNLNIAEQCSRAESFCRMLQTHNSHVVNIDPTHYSPNGRPSCIVLIIDNDLEKLYLFNQIGAISGTIKE